MPLAFPTVALYQDYRIDSASGAGDYTNDGSETGTPYSANLNDEFVIDPALLAESGTSQPQHTPQYHNLSFPPPNFPNVYQPPLPPHHPAYPPGPYGDPYVNPVDHNIYPPNDYFQQHPVYPPGHPYPPQETPYPSPALHEDLSHQDRPPSRPPKPAKPKRKRPRRELNCSFCRGTDQNNKHGVEEPMVSCVNCGRSGHPSCLQIPEIGDVIRNYPWKCIECKTCELCSKKGDDTLLLLCDQCDRGWHSYCLSPPLSGPPTGSWACPTCIPNIAEGSATLRRSSSIASTSHVLKEETSVNGDVVMNGDADLNGQIHKQPSKRKGKEKEVPAEEASVPPQARSSKDKTKRGRTRNRSESTSQSAPALIPSSPPVPPPPLPSSPTRSATRGSRTKVVADNVPEASHSVSRVRLRVSTTSLKKGKGKVKDVPPDSAEMGDEEEESGLFEGLLTEGDADTSKTTILAEDKNRFERSRANAEAKLQPLLLPPPHVAGSSDGMRSPSATITEVAEHPAPPVNVRPLRSFASAPQLQRRTSGPALAKPLTGKGKGKGPPPTEMQQSSPATPLRIKRIRFGDFEIDTWFDAPFPEEYSFVPDGTLWICEFCLKYMKSRLTANRHRLKCKARHPPGDEIYRDDAVSIFEVDGRKNKIYCQNLCLLSKMFLDHKSLFYDVEPFLFYVMTELDDRGARFVGYFSKEKRSVKDYNLSCIMTLPVRQRKGWGNLLIDFSYLLSKVEGRIGGPETPLSALGAISYHRYWTLTLMYCLQTLQEPATLSRISAQTSMTREDVLATLEKQGMITIDDDPRNRNGNKTPRPRGRPPKAATTGGIARRNLARASETCVTNHQEGDETPAVRLPRKYCIKWDPEAVNKYIADWEKKGNLRLRPERLKWSPFVLSRTQGIDGEAGIEYAGGSGSDAASVEYMLKLAEAEREQMELDILERLQQDKLLEADALLQSEAHHRSSRYHRSSIGRSRSRLLSHDHDESMAGSASPRGPSESRPLRATRSSLRDLASAFNESGSRASRSAAPYSRTASLSPDEGDDDAGRSSVRTSRRLRLRASGVGLNSRASALSALQKRKKSAKGLSSGEEESEEDDEDERDRKRPRARLSRGRSSLAVEDLVDMDPVAAPVDDAPRSLRSLRHRNPLANGVNGSATPKESTPQALQRKRRRIESSPEVDTSPAREPVTPVAQRTQPLPSEEDPETPKNVRARLRSKKFEDSTPSERVVHSPQSVTPKRRPRAQNGTFVKLPPSPVNKRGRTNKSGKMAFADADAVRGTVESSVPAQEPSVTVEAVLAVPEPSRPFAAALDPLSLLAEAATVTLGAVSVSDEERDAEGEEVDGEFDGGEEDVDADGETDEEVVEGF